MITTVIIFIAVLSVLVFVHEFGHFISAKRAGVRVDEFGFGFPPRAFGIKRGDTIYSVNWIPLGGFVKIKGESGEHEGDEDSFAHKPAWRRAIILCAGVVMNLVLAWTLLTVGYAIGLPQITEGVSPYAHVSDRRIQVVRVLPGSPADAAGIEVGDTFISVDGVAYGDIPDFRGYTGERAGTAIVLGIEHDGEAATVEVAPEFLDETGRAGIGIALVETGIARYPVWLAPVQALDATWGLLTQIFDAFGALISSIFVAHAPEVEFSGPVGIAVLTSRAAKAGFRYLLQFTAVLSVNLAVINILPFPALDGGRLLFLLLERLRGRAISRRIEIAAHNLGFTALIILVLVVTYRDVVRFGGSIWRAIGAFFGA